MIPSERRDYIYRYVHEYQLASISALSELMSVSHMTVRRDIRVLEEQGKVVSVSGGVRLSEALRQELAYCEKAQLHHRHKREIGKYAAGLVEDGQVVYLDAGTTTFEIARSLAERFNLTVVTNDFSIIQHLMNRPQLSLFHTGGQVDQRNYSCVGNSAAMLLRSLNIDVAFISTSSWDLEHGLHAARGEGAGQAGAAGGRPPPGAGLRQQQVRQIRHVPRLSAGGAERHHLRRRAAAGGAAGCASAVCNCTTSNSDNNNARERSTI